MIYLELFLGFLRVGFFAFGGAYAAIPLIRDVVLSYGWLNDETLSYMIAVSESTPGPIMVNLATYVGSSQAGFLGAAIATAAVVLPSYFIILLLITLLQNLLRKPWLQAILGGLKPCMIGIILAVGAAMIFNHCFRPLGNFAPDFRALGITLFLALILVTSRRIFKKNISPIRLILIAAVLGMAVYAI